MKKFILKLKTFAIAHKVASAVVVLLVVSGGYYTYKGAVAKSTAPQYTLSPAHIGSLTQTVTGSGQVSASNQLDVTSQVSGTINSINVKVGQHVEAGDLLATIDPKDALTTLENAKIAYAKLVQPPKEGDVTNAQNDLMKAYSDGYNTVSITFSHIPAVMSGLNDLLNSSTGYLSQQKEVTFTETGKNYTNTARASFDKANNQYSDILARYNLLSKTSATSSIEAIISDTYDFTKLVSTAVKDAQSAATFVAVSQPTYNTSGATTASSNLTSWSSQIGGDLSSLLSSKNSIASSRNTLGNLLQGADTLDIQSQQVSLKQAEDTYSKYFIRAPFSGIVGRIPVNVYGQAGANTVIATVVGDQKIATISLNEVDAAKVLAGQPVTITFDAIDGLVASGTVSEIDQVGTVSQGVVSYGVKINIATSDPRIKPGMSVNTTIITMQKDNVLLVPTAAIKTQGNTKYVEVLKPELASSTFTGGRQFGNRNVSTTGQLGGQPGNQATTTRQFGNRTGNGAFGANGFSITISSPTLPEKVTVTTGDSDDTNTEITSGLNRGQFVVTKTSTTASTATKAPSILNSFGGNRAGGAGTNRAGNVRIGG